MGQKSNESSRQKSKPNFVTYLGASLNANAAIYPGNPVKLMENCEAGNNEETSFRRGADGWS